MSLKPKLDYLVLAPEDDELTPGGGGAQPAASSDDEGEAPDPVVDDFIKAGTKSEAAPSEEAPAPAEKPGEQPPAPAAAPETPKPGEAPAPTPPAESKPPAATPPAQPLAAAPTPPVAPAAPPATPAPAAQPPATPAPEAPTPPAAPPAPPQPSAEEQEKARKQQREAYVKQLTEGYAIPPEEHDALLTSPETVLPKLAAEVHTRAVEAAIGAVMSNIEPIVLSVLERQKVYKQSEEEFFSKWPKLNTPEGRQHATRLMATYVQMHKDATREQVMNDVGLMAMTQLRIPLDIPGTTSDTPAAPPAALIPPAPPATPGGAPVIQPPAKPGMWDKVDQELFGDER